VGADGPTHAGSFDIGFMGALPGMVLMGTADEAELAHAIATVPRHNTNFAIFIMIFSPRSFSR
jgi:deoxyxylulose-5-phosphate synthase